MFSAAKYLPGFFAAFKVMVLIFIALAATLPAYAAPKNPAPAPAEESPISYAILRGLNKVTARTETLEIPIGTVMRFGNLEIVALSCWSSEPEQHPEEAVLLDIRELKPGESPERIFVGWMFASSPSLSSLEHPVYDLTVAGCRKGAMKDEKE